MRFGCIGKDDLVFIGGKVKIGSLFFKAVEEIFIETLPVLHGELRGWIGGGKAELMGNLEESLALQQILCNILQCFIEKNSALCDLREFLEGRAQLDRIVNKATVFSALFNTRGIAEEAGIVSLFTVNRKDGCCSEQLSGIKLCIPGDKIDCETEEGVDGFCSVEFDHMEGFFGKCRRDKAKEFCIRRIWHAKAHFS